MLVAAGQRPATIQGRKQIDSLAGSLIRPLSIDRPVGTQTCYPCVGVDIELEVSPYVRRLQLEVITLVALEG
jgi:hypothetical protein